MDTKIPTISSLDPSGKILFSFINPNDLFLHRMNSDTTPMPVSCISMLFDNSWFGKANPIWYQVHRKRIKIRKSFIDAAREGFPGIL